MIKVIIIDDHPVVLEGIRNILIRDPEMRFGNIEVARNGKELFKKLPGNSFNLIILDISLPGRSGLDLLQDIKREYPKIPVVILSMYPEEQYAVRALKLGASAYLTKMSAPEELITCLLKVNNGGRYITSSLAEKISFDTVDERDKPPKELLSVRELEILTLFANGKTISSIAEELSLSPKTISTYRGRILAKLNLKTTSDIIRFAISEGLA